MAVNEGFRIPRKTQKVTAVTPTTILQYAELIGNLPSRRSFGLRIPPVDAPEIYGQAFIPPKNKIKAIGLYIQVDFRPQGQRRDGSVMLKLWSWAGYPAFPPTEILYPVSGRPAEVEIDVENIINLNETIFEFEEYIPLTIGDTYFFTIVQTEGYAEKRPLYLSTSAERYGTSIQGDLWIWNVSNPALCRRRTPIGDLVFDSYVSITELSVELVGDGSGNLTDIQNALTVNPGQNTPQVAFGAIDYLKPFKTHGNAVITDTDVFGDAPITVGPHAGFSDVADLVVDMKTVAGLDNTNVSGLDDLTVDETFVGEKDLVFRITVSVGGMTSPNTFDWSAKDTDGNLIASGTLNMTLAPQSVYSGLDIYFGSLTGHTSGDYWEIYVANWDFAIVRVATDRIRMDWGESGATLDCGTSFRLMEEGDAVALPEYMSKFAFRKHDAGDADPTISITLWRTDRP